jgi:hypothetical protein
MSFEDYSRLFTHCNICHMMNTSFFSFKKKWYEVILHGEWHVLGQNGGGEYQVSAALTLSVLMGWDLAEWLEMCASIPKITCRFKSQRWQ